MQGAPGGPKEAGEAIAAPWYNLPVKLWTTVSLDRLPHILKNGLDNPYAEEIQVSQIPELGPSRLSRWKTRSPS